MIYRGRRRGIFAALALLLAASVLVLVPAAEPAAQAASTEVVFDNMEHGDPFGHGWFAFGGTVGGGGIAPNTVDLPPDSTGSFSLESGWGSGGTPGYYGGFGRTFPVDLTGTAHFNFWINPDPGQDYTLEINLQDDDNSDDAIDTANDDEFQYNCVVAAAGPCAVSGGGWQLVSIPLADFFDDNSYLTGGNGVLDAVPASGGGNGQLINVVIAVIGNSGSDASFRTDDWTFTDMPLVVPTVIDDFESGLPSGTDGDGNAIGFFTFNDSDSTVSIAVTNTPPAVVPGSDLANNVLQVDTNVNDTNGFAGVIHAFANATVDTWVTQDWSGSEGISFWLYGNGTGKTLFLDILDNRAPGTTGDTAERFSINLPDDFSGWQFFEIPFAELSRKEVGNGAPNDGFTLTQVHGWAFGVFDAGEPFTNYIDDVSIYGVAELPELAVQFTANDFEISEGASGDISVSLNRALGDDDPAQVSVDYSVATIIAEPGKDYVEPPAGTLVFSKGGSSTQSFSIQTVDDLKYEPTERLILRLSNPVDVALGTVLQASASIIDNDPYDPLLLDDFEDDPYFWDALGGTTITQQEIELGDPNEVPNQGAFEGVAEITAPQVVAIDVAANLCNAGNGVVPVAILTTDDFDATTVDHTTVFFGEASETHVDRKTGVVRRHVEDYDGDGDLDLVFHFRYSETGLPCDSSAAVLTGETYDGGGIIAGADPQVIRDFPIGQDWSLPGGLSFWWYGTGSGDEVQVLLKDNRAADPGPAGWSLVWADEFDDAAGTPPNPEYWGYELGDGTVNGIPGWGNDELQYYTDSTDNAATDGNGNLVITAADATGDDLNCYYGECDYTSARLATKNKAEFAYGRIESRILVPDGGAGLWPAFWSLGTDIDLVDWPQTGEIDFMEYVSRLPNEIFGTIHGPGYSGGQSYGNVYDFGGPVSDDYHTFTIEWQPDLIEWYVDGIRYHTATPADVAPNEWVFNDPVYVLLNMAIGGNFGGPLDPDLTFPQEMKVDYVRVYQGPDTAERFEATFVDDFAGWEKKEVPFTAFTRSADQPDGAPDDGLTLSDVWGYGFGLPAGTGAGSVLVDQVRLAAPAQVTVANTNDSGPGSLREAVQVVASGGLIDFDPGLAGETIALSSPIVLSRGVTIDGDTAPGISLDGGAVDRVLIVDAGTTASINGLTMTNGYGWQLAGCVLNNGNLTLDHVTVTGCLMATDAGDFWQGGGGIYNGDGATLDLIDSTVSDNNAGWSGGGVYSFFNTTTNVVRSTISGNVSNDVGGGIRSLGDATIVNSTISGNESTGWYGGAVFITDGTVDMTNVTITDNISPVFAPAAVFVGTFGDSSATLNVANTIIADSPGCFLAPFGPGAVAINSLGNNVFVDATCNPIGTDLIVSDPGLDVLAPNGGPTLTHALLPGSPAIDAGNDSLCPLTDQRGVDRSLTAPCDVGAFELE